MTSLTTWSAIYSKKGVTFNFDVLIWTYIVSFSFEHFQVHLYDIYLYNIIILKSSNMRDWRGRERSNGRLERERDE